MKIGHYTGNIWAPGGIAAYIRRISDAQTRRGHELFFFDTVRPAAEQDCDTPAIEYVDDDTALLKRAAEMQLDLLHVHTTLRTDVPAPLPLLRTVHFHRPYCPSGSRFLKRQEVECNRNYSVSGCLWGHFIDRCGSIRPAELRREFDATGFELRRLDRIHSVAISEFVKHQMMRAGYPDELVHVLQQPAPPAAPYVAPPQDGVPRFLFLGRIVPSKGVEWLLRAAKRSKQSWHLDIAGSGPEEDAMRRLCAQLGLTERIKFHGWVGAEETKALFDACRATVVPSIWHEPAGLVHLESASHGRASILSRVGGMPDYAARYQHASLVPTRDEAALAASLDELAIDAAKATRMGRAGYDTIQSTHGLSEHMDALQELYARAIADFQKSEVVRA